MTSGKNIKWWIGRVSFSALFLFIGLFAYYKMDFLIKGVQITAHVERDSSSPLLQIKGNAEHATKLSLNGREIFIDKDGSFSESVALLPGLGVVTLDAEDKFGKTSKKKFEIVYEGKTNTVALIKSDTKEKEIINTN